MNSRIIPVLALLLAIGMFFAYVDPTWSGPVATTKAAIASDDQALVAAGKYVAQENQLASERDAINPNDLARLSVFLPDSVDNVRLILDLNALAARSGLSLSDVNVSANSADSSSAEAVPATPASLVHSADLSLSALGSYTALQTFLAGIEKSERLLDVRDISVNGSDTGVYTYKMAIRLYWLQ